MNILMQGIKTILKKLGLRKILLNYDREFLEFYERIRGYTLVSDERAYILYQLAKSVNKLGGDVAEIGVYKGGTAMLLAKFLDSKGKNLYLFDTFQGMPKVNPKYDLHKEGDFSDTSFDDIKRLLREFKNVKIFRGIFPETAHPISDRVFCFVHIDVDIYQSVKDCCDFFYRRMIPGGVIVFDDYGFPSCKGAKKAVDEFFKDKSDIGFYLQTGQYIVIRREGD